MKLAIAAAAVVLTSAAVAGAAELVGTAGGNLIVGTRAVDRVDAGAGADRIVVWGDGRRDRVSCGAGLDLVNAELNDVLDRSCETVARQVSRDRTPAGVSGSPQRGTQAEPHSLAVGNTIVTVFQTGRFRDGGAAAVGFSTSRDSGRSWRGGTLPAVRGYERQTDPVVAYDATRGTWLAAVLALADAGGTALLVSRSPDGISWQPPVVAAEDDDPEAGLDKEWITCDNGDASPYRGRCYLAASDLTLSSIRVQASLDGGATWSAPVYPRRTSPQGAVGALPIVLPNGDLVVLLLDVADGPAALRSTDGGRGSCPSTACSEATTTRSGAFGAAS